MAMIDTLETARTLEKQGFTQSRAEALAHALKRAVTDEIPTKSDFTEFRGDVTRLRGEVSDLRSDVSGLRKDFFDLRDNFTVLRREFIDLKGTVNLLTCMVGVNMTLTLLVLGKLLLAGRP